jgi:predicted TPR repeat methyltransferase
MLEHARAKHVYDELVEGELTEYLRAHPREFDLIVSADTLVYFGALDDVVAAAGSALRPGGVMIFTVEEAIEPADADGFAIQPHGRFTHGAAYVERLLAGVGLRAAVGRDELRKESGLPVPGLVIRATKDAGAAAREAGVAASGIGARHG